VIVAYAVAALLVVGVAAGALAHAWHSAHRRPITDLRRRQIDAYQSRYGVRDPRPPT
jgi:hypothetical protein